MNKAHNQASFHTRSSNATPKKSLVLHLCGIGCCISRHHIGLHGQHRRDIPGLPAEAPSWAAVAIIDGVSVFDHPQPARQCSDSRTTPSCGMDFHGATFRQSRSCDAQIHPVGDSRFHFFLCFTLVARLLPCSPVYCYVQCRSQSTTMTTMRCSARPSRSAIKAVLQVLFLAGLSGCTPPHHEPAAPESVGVASPSNASAPGNSNSADLTFLGTVISIEVADTGDRFKNWLVTTGVDKVVSGGFFGSQFSFAVHSPSRSRLEVGKQYRIRAARTQEGYLVDQDQW